MDERNRTCEFCGKQFSYVIGRGKDRTICGEVCRKAARKNALEKRKLSLPKCLADGCDSVATRVGSGLCETHYYRLRRTGSLNVSVVRVDYSECQYCGKCTLGGSKYCSSRCSTRASRGNSRFRKCASCGIEFEPTNNGVDKVTCSPKCDAEHVRKYAREYYAKKMASDPGFIDKVRGAEFKRKSLKRDAFVEHVSRDGVMSRDKWICHLCGLRIPKSAKWPDRMFGTLDHVIPLSKGGKHSYANIKAAHLSCNCSKNDRTIGQLGLEFVA